MPHNNRLQRTDPLRGPPLMLGVRERETFHLAPVQTYGHVDFLVLTFTCGKSPI